MWMVDSEVRQEHAESTHNLVIIKIPNLLHGSVDTPKSVQFFKSKSCVVLTNTELRYRCRQNPKTDLTPGLSYPEAETTTWRNRGHDQDNSRENGEMMSHTSVGRPHALISSIEETNASQPQTQSNLMSYPSKEFIQIDKRM